MQSSIKYLLFLSELGDRASRDLACLLSRANLEEIVQLTAVLALTCNCEVEVMPNFVVALLQWVSP